MQNSAECLDLIKIISDPLLANDAWQKKIKTLAKEDNFLLMLSALFEFIYTKLEKNLSTNIFPIISENLLRETLLAKLAPQIRPLLYRVCILELHTMRENQLLQGATAEQRFDYFIDLLCNLKNSIDLLKKYTWLKQQLEIIASQEIQVFDELLQRLKQDYTEITYLINDIHAAQLNKITFSGDRHQRGHAVAILEFSNSKGIAKLVYKPRSIAIEAAFQEFLQWFNQRTSGPQLKTFQVLDKNHYGWCEFIEHSNCANEQEVKYFYQRLGAWLMLAYLLNASDIHAENIIAAGEHPVIVDYECFFKPLIVKQEAKSRVSPRHLVSRTHFLPTKLTSNDIDLSALFAQIDQESTNYSLSFADCGKDTMHVTRTIVKPQKFINQPKLNTSDVNPLAYEQEFLSGFTDSYQTILKNLTELLSDHSPLQRFRKVQIRILFRNTAEYWKLLIESGHPKLIYNKQARQQHFDWLYNITETSLLFEKIIPTELDDLYHRDIPAFYTYADSQNVFSSLAASCQTILYYRR